MKTCLGTLAYNARFRSFLNASVQMFNHAAHQSPREGGADVGAERPPCPDVKGMQGNCVIVSTRHTTQGLLAEDESCGGDADADDAAYVNCLLLQKRTFEMKSTGMVRLRSDPLSLDEAPGLSLRRHLSTPCKGLEPLSVRVFKMRSSYDVDFYSLPAVEHDGFQAPSHHRLKHLSRNVVTSCHVESLCPAVP